ncbi:MAG: beta-N-acetylhexosaminidase [Flavobacteriaceae bacterium]|nr:beta-N-acetylhexosaminidase [Flavobacteriaceae bacterium]|tara:strand:- start:86307 stop:88565 length:2259 start_codon:yes stop_codon:yes gene_type:complete
MRIQLSFKFLFILFFLGCTSKIPEPVAPNIIPKPISQTIRTGSFLLNQETELHFDDGFEDIANYALDYIEETYEIQLNSKKGSNSIRILKDDSNANEEGYRLEVAENKIEIHANNSRGAFYAIQTLWQLLPVETSQKNIHIQCIYIEDAPRFSYRGMHLDVARHFFSVDFIKRYLDLMAMLKMNTFHWHLTEDQGWRIEIKKYPKLQEIAAFRNETLIGHYSDQPHQFDGKKYGGYYTQKEIKEIVAYASERQITVIPEIEMPGHSRAAIAAYPELGCTGEQISVATKWGVFEDVYCPSETTFQFLEDVIDEVVELFPGKYIHIGGDEAPKTQWKNSALCQQIIREKGLKDEHELQSYFITRMEKYINSKGKQIIGWDEILEGGLAPNATVMSWRGTNGAVEAAKEGHNVILTPGSHCYFDHYQSDNENEPLAIGGFLPLERVYSFEPIPEELNAKEGKFVLGAQGNVWTEYIKTPSQVEYMVFPRAIALSEVVWSAKENRDYGDFVGRLEFFNQRLDAKKVNYANHLYDVKGKLEIQKGELSYSLQTTTNKQIKYSINGGNLNRSYQGPIPIKQSSEIKAAVFNKEGTQLGNTFTQKINLHKAVGANIQLNVAPHPKYNVGGKQALINGISGSNKRYGDTEWLGFSGNDLEISIQFKEPTEITSIATRFHNGNGQWIYAPKEIQVQFDNEEAIFTQKTNSSELLVPVKLDNFGVKKVQNISISIPNYGKIPEGKQGAGHRAWTFVDELIIN